MQNQIICWQNLFIIFIKPKENQEEISARVLFSYYDLYFGCHHRRLLSLQ